MDNCPPCSALAPKLEEVAAAFAGQVEVFQVKVDEESPLLQGYEIKGMPMVLLFEDGQLTGRLAGLIQKQDLDDTFEEMVRTVI
jgi:thioredoxin 1